MSVISFPFSPSECVWWCSFHPLIPLLLMGNAQCTFLCSAWCLSVSSMTSHLTLDHIHYKNGNETGCRRSSEGQACFVVPCLKQFGCRLTVPGACGRMWVRLQTHSISVKVPRCPICLYFVHCLCYDPLCFVLFVVKYR